MGRRAACKCGRCADCIKRAAIKKDKAATRMVKFRAAKKAAGDSTEQEKDTKAKKRKRAALRAADDRTEQEKNTKARQLKRAALRESRLQMA